MAVRVRVAVWVGTLLLCGMGWCGLVTSRRGTVYIFDGVACAASHDYVTHLLSFSNFAHSGGTRGRRGAAGGRAARKGRRRTVERCLAIPLSGDSHMVCSHSMFSRSMFSQRSSPRLSRSQMRRDRLRGVEWSAIESVDPMSEYPRSVIEVSTGRFRRCEHPIHLPPLVCMDGDATRKIVTPAISLAVPGR